MFRIYFHSIQKFEKKKNKMEKGLVLRIVTEWIWLSSSVNGNSQIHK